MSLRSTFQCNTDEASLVQMSPADCAANIAATLKSLQEFGIANVWIRLVEDLDSEFNAS